MRQLLGSKAHRHRFKGRRRSFLWLLSAAFFCWLIVLVLFTMFRSPLPMRQQVLLRPQEVDVVDQARAAVCRKEISNTSHAARLYSVVFDIGSTGSRVHVFRLKSEPGGSCEGVGCLSIEDELFVEDHNPLSKIMDPMACVDAITPLYTKAIEYVPREQRSCTLVEFKATAGLRKIGREKADLILDKLYDHFSRQDFWLRGRSACRIMEGREEGPMAWMTVNFLLGTFKSADKPTAAIIDLGGGSTQIVFEPKVEPNIFELHVHTSFKFEERVGSRQVRAYQHSYDGYGLHEAVNTLLCRVAETCKTAIQPAKGVVRPQEKTEFACFAGGFSDPDSGLRNTKTEPDFAHCVELFTGVVLHPGGEPCRASTCGIGQVYQPAMDQFDGPIYAFSFIYDLMKETMDTSTPGGAVLTPKAIAEVGQKKCSALTETLASVSDPKKPNSSLSYKYECMYYAYVYALLTQGYRIDDARELHVAKKINGIETAWALGAGLMTLGKV